VKGPLLAAAAAVLLGSAAARAELPAELGAVEGRVVWLDFWASWCTPCRRSFPWMNAMHEKYGADGLQIIGINLDKDRDLAAEFLDEIPAAFAIHYDPDASLAETFDVQAMPSSFLLDASGNVLSRHFGFKLESTGEYEASITSALAEAAGH
jgi:thiol-disulfide isomerase/thioredoxin